MAIPREDPCVARALVESTASITAQLKSGSNAQVYACLISHGWRRPSHSDRIELIQYGYACENLVFVREVLLLTGHTCRALGRVMLPAAQVALMPWVTRLGARPFGDVLFQQFSPTRERITRRFCRFNNIARAFSVRARHLAVDSGFKARKPYWNRSSVLVIPGVQARHCFVTECFL